MDVMAWLALSGMVRHYEDVAHTEWVLDGHVSLDTAEKLRQARAEYDAQMKPALDRPEPAIILPR